MQLRFSSALGAPVVSEQEGSAIGEVTGICIHPDTAKVEGFFVGALFLSSLDILRWTDRVVVARADVLSPVEDLVRLRTLVEGRRPVLGQRVRTESGKSLGRCGDVQFDCTHFTVEWIFPRRFFRNGVPIPVSQIQEVRPEGIVVRDAAPTEEAKEERGSDLQTASIIPPIPEAA